MVLAGLILWIRQSVTSSQYVPERRSFLIVVSSKISAK